MKTCYVHTFDKSPLFYRQWKASADTKNVILIIHGMVEHSLRYSEFGQYMASRGHAVCSFDLRGLGFTGQRNNALGIMDRDKTLRDIVFIAERMKMQYSDRPFILAGHSMGSLLVRDIIMKSNLQIDGALLSATPSVYSLLEIMGLALAGFERIRVGDCGKSKLLWKINFGKYNSYFDNPETFFDWLSSDSNEVRKYVNDPLCGFVPSAKFYYDMIKSVIELSSVRLSEINRDASILFIGGRQDPVSDFGRGPEIIAGRFRDAGYSNVNLKIYDNCRHEPFHEHIRLNVFNDINKWALSL